MKTSIKRTMGMEMTTLFDLFVGKGKSVFRSDWAPRVFLLVFYTCFWEDVLGLT